MGYGDNINDEFDGNTLEENYYVKMRYNGNYIPVCNLTSYECPFPLFEEKFARIIVDNASYFEIC